MQEKYQCPDQLPVLLLFLKNSCINKCEWSSNSSGKYVTFGLLELKHFKAHVKAMDISTLVKS